jgi:low temperature requirement protein LtrA
MSHAQNGAPAAAHPLLRLRDGHHARVTYEELFFDLVYVFAVTQVSHGLLHHLTPAGVVEALILWFAVWLGWQYTCWVTNWFNPQAAPIRALLFVTMLLALVMSASIPAAFVERGMLFAGSYVAMQVGRTAFIALQLPGAHPLAPNFRRILGWVLISACFWIAGALADGRERVLWWLGGIVCEYVAPMFGFALPGLGRSRTRDWTIEGGHLAERCQLFVIVALGEAVLATGASLSDTRIWNAPVVWALLATFVGSLSMWWLYFGTSSEDATRAITRSSDPGRMGAYFHYIHAILVAGIIVAAVGHDLILVSPNGMPTLAQAAVLAGGPAVYMLGSAVYKRVVYGVVALSHVFGVLALLALMPLALALGALPAAWASAAILLCVGWVERRAMRRCENSARA